MDSNMQTSTTQLPTPRRHKRNWQTPQLVELPIRSTKGGGEPGPEGTFFEPTGGS